jgi:hypothetical protein
MTYDVRGDDYKLLVSAIHNDSVEMVETLLSHGIKDQNGLALIFAGSRNSEIVNLLHKNANHKSKK